MGSPFRTLGVKEISQDYKETQMQAWVAQGRASPSLFQDLALLKMQTGQVQKRPLLGTARAASVFLGCTTGKKNPILGHAIKNGLLTVSPIDMVFRERERERGLHRDFLGFGGNLLLLGQIPGKREPRSCNDTAHEMQTGNRAVAR